ncbi:YlxQ family RNA-binding protein [Alkalicoccus halolimnae]|uniref:YlxQ family RNA-binding protein n=1 Tax=Alkalicoccus halolimnae TaxID=1667239 RepID=A0A5C7FCY9_9BACI|nr:YlxQ family RNA-binding protein [Alkalicoccus halolimnae]TXF87338.1 YlxQ family RNA-binding protein [Alkalicoccus halolimnae]
MNSKQKSLIGLMLRAGALIMGEELAVKAIQTKKAKAVIISKDASENTLKKISDKCNYYKVPLIQTGDRYEIGEALGKEARVVLALTDKGFAEAFMKHEVKSAE